MAKIDFVNIKPWNGTTGSGKENREIIDGNFALVEEELEKKADKTGYYHVSQITGNYAYADRQTARNAVPSDFRNKGQVILYQLSTGDWIAEQFIGNNLSQWGDLYSWESFGSSSRVFDGGRSDSRYGGARIIDCGNALNN